MKLGGFKVGPKIQCQALSKGSEFEKVPGAGNPVGCQVGVANCYSELEKVSAVETFQNGPRKSARHWKSPLPKATVTFSFGTRLRGMRLAYIMMLWTGLRTTRAGELRTTLPKRVWADLTPIRFSSVLPQQLVSETSLDRLPPELQ